ncbi:hypothetical protein MJM83_31210, partial [Salmonella enterica subsp. enterica serovar Montevideo]|nr:hypothetical protein [Salmonella enterica subsp. enterica serovar Montevideo]
EANSVDAVKVRSVVSCDTDFGVCAHCYGRDLARGHIINKGEAITLSSGAGSPALFLCAAGLRHGMKGSGGDILEPIALPLLISL